MTPLVHPALGPILGEENDGVVIYRGIPFASIPRRFARAVMQTSLETRWSDEGTFDATKPGPTSVQPFHSPYQDAVEQSIPTDVITAEEGKHQSEFDCLNLTVHVPTLARTNDGGPTGNLPVLVFLHGGAFIWGSGDRSFYDPKTLLRHAVEVGKPLILVTANYRLGALGFLHSSKAKDAEGELLLPPNNGFYDQRILFQWVKAYIEGFGGDPANITSIGQSAGAESLSIHNMLSVYAEMPSEERPYLRSIVFSGSLLCMPAMNADSHEFEFKRIANQFGSKLTGRTSAELAHYMINQVEVNEFRDLGWHGAPCLETEMLPYKAANLETILNSGATVSPVDNDGRRPTKRWVSEQIVSSAKFDGGVTYHAVKSDESRRHDHTRAFREWTIGALQRYDMERSPGSIADDIFALYGIHADTDDDTSLRAINQLETDLSFILPTIYEAMAAARDTSAKSKVDIQQIPSADPATKTYLQLWQLPNPFDGLLEAGRWANHTYDIVSFFGAFEDRLDVAQQLIVREWRAKLLDFISLGGDAMGWASWTESDGHATIIDLDGIRTVNKDRYLGPRTRLGQLVAIGERIDLFYGLDHLFEIIVRPYLFNNFK